KEMVWSNYDLSVADDDQLLALEEPVARFFLSHTKAELYEEALKKRILLYPVYNIGEIVDSPHLESRDFWTEVKHDELDSVITYPGAFSKSSEVEIGIYRRPPLIGEHNVEIYQGELGLSGAELTLLAEANVI
ncbi:CoA transferase, partial [Chloroflexota bacterium]